MSARTQRELDQFFIDNAAFDRANRDQAARYFVEVMRDVPALGNAGDVRELKCEKCGASVYTSDPGVELAGDCELKPMNDAFPQAGVMRVHSQRRRPYP